MKFEKNNLSGSYDEKHDILYIYYKGRDYSYGTEDPDGVVTMRSISSDDVTGFLIYNFKLRSDLDLKRFDLLFRLAIEELTKELQDDSIAEAEIG